MEEARAAAGTARLEFTGKAGEYFRIWVVNVFLTVITLGIYSAWAKVRRNRYLYSSTRLAGAPFEYLARPQQILKGRAIAVGLLAVYVLSELVSSALQAVVAVVFLTFLPWLVVRARAFTLGNSAYRNIRFGFSAGYGDAAGVLLLWPILVGLSLGILYPVYVWRRSKFAIENSNFGSQLCAFTAGAGGFFLIYLKFLVLLIVVLVAGGVFVAYALRSSDAGSVGLAVLAVIATGFALLAVLSYMHVAAMNLTWSNIEIGGMRTLSELATSAMYWIALSNLIAIVLTFGLLIPWATIRMRRYRIERTSLLNTEKLPALLGATSREVGAAGEELSGLLGVDVAV